MARAVLVQHHAWERAAFPAFAMGAAPLGFSDQPGRLQYPLGPGVGAGDPMHFPHLLMEVLGGEPGIATAIQLLHLEYLIERGPPRRDLTDAFIDQSIQAVILIAPHPAPHRAHIHIQNLRHRFLAEPPRPMVDLSRCTKIAIAF